MANRFLSNIRINDAYTFPASDGNNGQFIATDGAGNLTFTDPSASSSASIIYRDNFTGDGTTTVFTLQNSLSDEDQTQIYIDGVYQEKSTYSLSTNAITFSTAPINGHSIEVISISGINVGPTTIYQDNFTGDGTTTDFTLAQAIDNEVKTMIYFNGVYQFKDTYTLNSTTISFDTAPANGVDIEVISIASAAAADYNQLVKFYGKATEAISKGDAVMLGGQQGDHFLLSKATQAAISSNHEYFLGLASQDLTTGEFGYVTEFGKINELDTSGYTAGDILWFDAGGSTAGALTTTEPAAPLVKIQVAAVIRSHQNEGVLFVRPTWYHELGELHDVNITSIADKDLLVWNNSNSYWENTKTLSDLTLTGNLTVNGTQTILNTQTVEVEDNILQLNTTQGSPDTATATTSGISVYRGDGVTQASFIFDDADDTWDLTNNLVVTGDGDALSVKRGSFKVVTNLTSVNHNIISTGKAFNIKTSDSNNLTFLTNNTIALTLDTSQNATFAGIITVNGGGIDIDNNDDVRLRFDNASVFKAGLQVVTTAGDMIAGSAVNDFAIRAQENMLFATGGNTERMRITSVGKVGIGLNPTGFYADQLVVNEGMTLYSTGNSFLCFADGSSGDDRRRGEIRYEHSSNTMAFMTDAATRMRIDSSGNVGIGETSPTSKLHVKDTPVATSGAILTLRNSQATASNTTFGGVFFNSAPGYDFSIGKSNVNSTTTLSFRNGNSGASLMDIDAAGNVGIGTTSPSQKLDVAGNIYATGRTQSANTLIGSQTISSTDFATLGSNSSGVGIAIARDYAPSSYPDIIINSSGNVGIGTASPDQKLDVVGKMKISDDIILAQTNGRIDYDNGNSNGALRFHSTSGNTERMRITSAGNVGIGTTSPDGNLEIVATSTVSGASDSVNNVLIGLQSTNRPTIILDTADTTYTNRTWNITNVGSAGSLFFGRNGLDVLVMKNDGNVGIGTDSPSDLLHLKKSSGDAALRIETVTGGDPTLYFNSAAANRSGLIRFQDNGTNIGRIEYVHNGDRLAFQAGSATGETLSIINGAVGIGTTLPQRRLHINSTNESTGIFLERTSNYGFVQYNEVVGSVETYHLGFVNNNTFSSDILVANESGNVGIGTTSPAEKLEVEGSSAVIKVQSTTAGANANIHFETTARKWGVGPNMALGSSDFEIYDYTAGQNRLVIDSSGDSTFSGAITISKTSSADLRLHSSTYSADFNLISGATGANKFGIYDNNGGAYRLLIDSSGNVGIGTTSPESGAKLDVRAGAGGKMVFGSYDANYKVVIEAGDQLNFYNGASSTLGLINYGQTGTPGSLLLSRNLFVEANSSGGTTGTVRIKSDGKVGINETSPINKVHITSADDLLWMEDTSGNANTEFVIFQAPGYTPIGSIIRNGSAGSILYNTSSDYRLKEDLQDFNALDLVDNITAYDYKWKDTEQRDYGFVAHELQEVMPNVVTGEKDGERMQSVDYSKLTPVLLKAIQELKAEIETLKLQING